MIRRCINVMRLDVVSTLKRLCINVVCLLGKFSECSVRIKFCLDPKRSTLEAPAYSILSYVLIRRKKA